MGLIFEKINGYKDGSFDATMALPTEQANTFRTAIGAVNNQGSPALFITAKIQAFAIYSKLLDATENLALATAMNLL